MMPASFQRGLKLIGGEICRLDRVDSTNNRARQIAETGAIEGFVVIADEQTDGRGQQGRSWQSPPDVNIYMSIILRPRIRPAQATCITIVMGVAAAEAISSCGADDVSIKWPNDILIRGKKVSGILTEMKVTKKGDIDFVIVGIGINVNMCRESFDASFRDAAISLQEVLSHTVSRRVVTDALLASFEKWYCIFIEGGFYKVREAWLSLCDCIGTTVTVNDGERRMTGTVLDINEQGALILSTAEGKRIIVSGEVTTGA